MIVLDTNVVSELMRTQPDMAVLRWMDAQSPATLWLNSVVVSELLYGVAKLPKGKRKEQLIVAVAAMVEEDFAGRVLSFDVHAATEYASLVVVRENAGLSVSMADAQIAAICLSQGATLATRNTKHFEGLGLTLINPWRHT